MDEQKRKEIVTKASKRILAHLDRLKGNNRMFYISHLVNMLGDTKLVALDFALEMAQLAEKERES